MSSIFCSAVGERPLWNDGEDGFVGIAAAAINESFCLIMIGDYCLPVTIQYLDSSLNAYGGSSRGRI